MSTPAENAGAEAARKIFDEKDPKVLIAYFLAFGIWTAAASNDFISSTWRSVGETRRRGKIHVALAFVLMIFMSVYIFFQQGTRDYKEMGAAILALAFAVLHLSRTFMGLWQLHVFKQWAISSIKSMESLGYKKTKIVEEEPGDSEDDDPDDDKDGLLQLLISGLKWVNERLWRKQRVESIADDIRVNDTLIDNRLSDVHTVCNFRLLSRKQNKIVKEEESLFKRLFWRYWYRLCNAPRALQLLFALVFRKNPRVLNSTSGPRLVPRHPESVWLNWATALVAQVNWKFEDNSHTDPNPSEGYARHRDWFAEQILWSASLHTQRTSSAGTDTLLAFPDWHKYPALCNGKFSKQEWLERACKTGIGLPYGVQHRKAKERKDGVQQWGYRNFESELLRAREALPPELETRMANFDVDRLEWFTIFVSVKDWTPRNSSLSSEGHRSSDESKSTSDSAVEIKENKAEAENGVPVEKDSTGEIKDSKAEAENDIPIENLKKQLGFTKEPNFILGRSKLPFLRNVPKAMLWGNRNVLEISCHIDNWIALCAGKQTSYMLERVPWMEHKLSLGNAFREGSTNGNLGGGDDYRSFDRFVDECAAFENCRFLCQMAKIKPKLSHFDKSLTFLGCSMEMLRSSLAKWAEKSENGGEGSWKPPLFAGDIVSASNQRRSATRFIGTDDFTSCLRSLSELKDMSKSFVKMRVLWELQDYLQTHLQNLLQENAIAPSNQEAIALCMLSFPALSVTVRRRRDTSGVQRRAEDTKESIKVFPGREGCFVVLHGRGGDQFGIENYEYIIRPSCGPQDLQLILQFEALVENSNAELSVVLCEIEGKQVDYFDWEAWRNAFYGRLEGCRRWKQKVGIPNSALVAPSQDINAGVCKVEGSKTAIIPGSGAGAEMCVWKGWRPHFASICKYEIATEGFILQAREIQGVPFAVTMTEDASYILAIVQEIWEPVNYSDASATSLKNASIVAQDLLCQRQGDVLSAEERTEIVLTRVTDTASSSELRLLEVAAIQDRNPNALKALEKAVRILMNRKNQVALRKGVALLERFYVFAKRGSCNLYLFWKNKEYVKKVKSLFEEIFKSSGYDRVVAERYRLFVLLLMRYGPRDMCKNTGSVALQSILYRCHSMEAAEATESVLSYYLSFHSSSSIEQVAVLVSAHSNAANEFDACTLKDLRDTADMCLDISVRANAKQAGGMNAVEEFMLSPYRMKELSKMLIEKGSPNAMSCLGGILERGGHGICRNVPQAVELYIKAIEKDGHVGAVTRLAPLMKKAGPLAENELRRVLNLYGRLIKDRGNRHAMNVLADFFSYGNLEDVGRAIDLYKRASSEHQDTHAMNMLANLLTRGDIGVLKDMPRAVVLYSQAINEGNHIYAMYNLARIFYKGDESIDESIAPDVRGALALIDRSINEGGNTDAMNWLGVMLANGGDGVPKDVPRAVELYSRAINDGNHTYAMFNFAVLLCKGEDGVERDVPRAMDLLNRSVEEGNNFDAMNRLGEMLAWGRYGVQKNPRRAVELLRRAVEEGKHTQAMYGFGALLSEGGEGIERDPRRAVELLNRSILEGGNFNAMNWLGVMLANGGDGVPKDVPRAVELYSRAINDGSHTYAMFNFAVLLCKGEDGVERDVPRAMDLLNRSIEEGNNFDAMNWLGTMLAWGGNGSEKNPRRAVELLRRAVEEGNHTQAMYGLGLLLSEGEGIERDHRRAVELLNRSILEGGNFNAMNWLGVMLANGGDGVRKDVPRAVELYSRAINDGNNTYAMFNFAMLLCKGEDGVERDVPRAMDLLNRSIDEGNNFDAMNWLGEMLAWGRYGVQKNPRRAVELLRRAVEEGNHTQAMCGLGALLSEGGEGIERDPRRAVELLNRSILEGGNFNAMNMLGVMHANGGDAVPKNVPRAADLYSRAIDDGSHTYAMFNFAVLLCKGEDGVERNVPRAMDLLNRSIEEGNNFDAMNRLGTMLAWGRYGVQKNPRRAVELLRRAVEEGNHTQAMCGLGALLSEGEGIERDHRHAVELLNRSILEGGNFNAMNMLGVMLANGGDGVPKDVPRAVELYSRAIDDGNNTYAMFNFAVLLCKGEDGVERDVPRAMDLLNRSIEEGNNFDAMNWLGEMLAWGRYGVQKNPRRAVELLRRAVEEGNHTQAMCGLGALLSEGGEGIERDHRHAVELLNRSILEGGNFNAMNWLGVMLANGGDGVPKNVPRAAELYSRAIDDGSHTYAMFNFAVLLCKGEDGVERDVPRAMDLLNRSIEEGNNFDAMNWLGEMLARGTYGVETNPNRAVNLLTRAIDEGNHQFAMYDLGLLLCEGEGVEQDIPRAAGLFERCIRESANVNSANVNAMVKLADLLRTGWDGVSKDLHQAIILYKCAVCYGQSRDAARKLAALLESTNGDV